MNHWDLKRQEAYFYTIQLLNNYSGMQKAEILKEISSICKNVFNDPALNVSESTSAKDVEGWDSMSNLFLIDAIENHYHMKFSLDDILNAQNIGDLCDLVSKRTASAK
jgi:acyl carrier protein